MDDSGFIAGLTPAQWDEIELAILLADAEEG